MPTIILCPPFHTHACNLTHTISHTQSHTQNPTRTILPKKHTPSHPRPHRRRVTNLPPPPPPSPLQSLSMYLVFEHNGGCHVFDTYPCLLDEHTHEPGSAKPSLAVVLLLLVRPEPHRVDPKPQPHGHSSSMGKALGSLENPMPVDPNTFPVLLLVRPSTLMPFPCCCYCCCWRGQQPSCLSRAAAAAAAAAGDASNPHALPVLLLLLLLLLLPLVRPATLMPCPCCCYSCCW